MLPGENSVLRLILSQWSQKWLERVNADLLALKPQTVIDGDGEAFAPLSSMDFTFGDNPTLMSAIMESEGVLERVTENPILREVCDLLIKLPVLPETQSRFPVDYADSVRRTLKPQYDDFFKQVIRLRVDRLRRMVRNDVPFEQMRPILMGISVLSRMTMSLP